MNGYRLVPLAEVPKPAQEVFFTQAFGPHKAAFLLEHGHWWHGGSRARFAVLDEQGQIVAYNALIASRIRRPQAVDEVLWLVDIYVLPQQRGKGLQHLLDEGLRALGRAQVGFPNAIAAPIHRKHGWGVRDDGWYMHWPISRRAQDSLRYRLGWQGKLLRGLARLDDPWQRRQRFASLQSVAAPQVRRLPTLDGALLASVFAQDQSSLTTLRDEAYFDWRYGQCPYPQQFRAYLAEDGDQQVALISRLLTIKGLRTLRIEDTFGSARPDLLRQALALALRDGLAQRAEHALAVTTDDAARTVYEDLGFRRGAPLAFCWYHQDAAWMAAIEALRPHWTFADSDLSYSA
ncbi:MAG: GNAT family N-acetyltransferase [Anaerolineae bacterium]|nr:GNAT family N-acetyltransferase [Anaerolineae bacterium]MDW8172255.1 GNAT family N-acetyltransferase [Anaerolineae bacterium]